MRKMAKTGQLANWPTGQLGSWLTQTQTKLNWTELKNAIATVLCCIDFLVGLILKAQG